MSMIENRKNNHVRNLYINRKNGRISLNYVFMEANILE